MTKRKREKSFTILTKVVHSGIDRKKLHRKKFYNNDREKTERDKKFYGIDQRCA